MRRFLLAFLLVTAGCSDAELAADAGVVDSGSNVDVDTGATDGGSDSGSETTPLNWTYDERGPFNVGHREWEISYEARPDGTVRTIPLHVWYPTEANDGPGVRYVGLFADPEAIDGAELAASPWADGTYPVHLYSHGHQGFSGSSAEILHHFVTHGWVVVAPDHIGDTFVDAESPVAVRTHHLRSQDLTASLDALEVLSGDPLAGNLRLGRVLLSGHSLGAFSVWASVGGAFDPVDIEAQCDERAGRTSADCLPNEAEAFEALGDGRIAAAIPMAGVLRNEWFTTDGHAGIEVPVLSLTGTEDDVGQVEQWDRIDGIDHRWAEFEGACHQFFSVGNCPLFVREEGVPLLQALMFAFARVEILGDTTPEVIAVAAGELSLSDRIDYRVR